MKRLIFLFITLSTLITSCFDFGSEFEGCNGQIVIENEIPDTTLTVGGSEYRRDISEPPIVFSHTENERIRINVIASDLDVVGAGTGIDEDSNRHVIRVIPRNPGSTKIQVSAMDDCEGYQVITTFNVSVREETETKK